MEDLTKWSRLLVVGEDITPEQASVVIMRTTGWKLLSSNDHEWQRDVRSCLGLPPEDWWLNHPASVREQFERRIEEFQREIGVLLGLDYLQNHRIMSSWIGGPHGWCDWDGTIGAANYNIGKWPGIEEFYAEWKILAQALPFLTMTAQLVPQEGAQGNAVVECKMSQGKTSLAEGWFPLVAEPIEPNLSILLFRSEGERGVTLARLREAYEHVRRAR